MNIVSRFLPLLVMALLLQGCVTTTPTPVIDMEVLAQHRLTTPVDTGHTLIINALPGDLVLVPSDSGELEASVSIRCREGSGACQRYHRELAFETREENGTLILAFNKGVLGNTGHTMLRTRLGVPRVAAIEVNMFAGELTVSDVDAGSLLLDVNSGEINVAIAADKVAAVQLDTGVGEATLYAPERYTKGRRTWLVGAEIDERFAASGMVIDADLQFGEITVRMRE